MTRALCTRSSKRRPANSSQEVVPEDCKENSPSILSQSSRSIKKLSGSGIRNATWKEDKLHKEVSHSLKSAPLNANKNLCSPVRKSVRRFKSPFAEQSKLIDPNINKHVLCDKTNSPQISRNKSKEYDVLATIENKKGFFQKCVTVPKLDANNPRMRNFPNDNITDKENHVPIYNTVSSLKMLSGNELPDEKKDAVYEFEVDENEDPVHKKRRKKRTYVKTRKIGPKALTINNIKYSSSESLVSLPERLVPQKKKTNQKSNLKQYSSVTNLNESEDTCSVQSFMSHPPSLRLCNNKTLKPKLKLSVVEETQSEQSQSQSPNNNINEVCDKQLHIDPSGCNSTTPFNSGVMAVLKCDDQTTSLNAHFSPNPRCYVSKTKYSHISTLEHGSFYQSTANNSLAHQTISCSPNTSAASTRDFLSSTPCKRISVIACNNSVFDDSYDLPQGLRPSTGFSENALGETKILNDHCFGFDEPEELEEPLLSPIKNNINLQPKKTVKIFSCETEPWEKQLPKPTPQEIIEMLKASIPKVTYKESSEVFDNSSLECNSSPPRTHETKGTTVYFKKPPRRSYERQRRVRHHSDHEEEESDKSDQEEKEKDPKIVKNCYKKTNKTKSTKPPKTTKAKNKSAKEEQEMERLAALMNAQFQEIEKVNLVVE